MLLFFVTYNNRSNGTMICTLTPIKLNRYTFCLKRTMKFLLAKNALRVLAIKYVEITCLLKHENKLLEF